MSYHLAFASLSPAQMLHFQGSSPQPIPPTCHNPVRIYYSPMEGACLATALLHLPKPRSGCGPCYPPWHSTWSMWWVLHECSLPRLCHCSLAVRRQPSPTPQSVSWHHPHLWPTLGGQHLSCRTPRTPCSTPGNHRTLFFHRVISRLVIVGCDNLGALHQAQQTQELTPVAPSMLTSSKPSTGSASGYQVLLSTFNMWKVIKTTYSLHPPCSAWPNSISWQTNLQSIHSSTFYITNSTRWTCLWTMHGPYRWITRQSPLNCTHRFFATLGIMQPTSTW